MKEFGFYVVKLREGNKKAGIEASDILTGEVDMTSECYKNLDIEEACEKRISQEIASSKNGFNTFTLDSVETHRYFTVSSEKTSHIDSEIRNYICEHTSAEKVDLKDNSRTEFLRNISFEEVCKEVEKYLGGKDSRRVKEYSPRNYQENLINQMKRILKIHKRCLLNAAMRSGKSFMCLEVCRSLFIKNILILSPFTSARKSFQEVIEEDKAFTGWTFYTKDKLDSIEENSTKNCVFLSFQYFDTKMEKEALKNLLAKIKFDTVIIDETHSTSDTERSQEILKIVNPKYQIHASGTPINDLLAARFAAFETISFDFIDLKKTGEVDFPEFYVNSVTNLDKLNSILRSKDPDLFSKKKNYTFQEIFENKKYLRVFFKWVFNGNIDFAELNHYLMYVPSAKAVGTAVEVLKNLDIPFKVERLGTKSSDYEDFVNKFEYENEKTIIVTCDKATTGNTFPKCDGIMIFKNIRSAEKFLQIIFRCMTPNKGKRKAIVYNFDDISEKLAFKEFARVRAVTKHISKQEALKGILDTIHIRSLRNPDCKNGRFEFFEETWSTYFTKISNLPVSYLDEMENLFTIYPELNESDKQVLKNLKNITTKDSQSTTNVGDDSYQSGETGIGKVTKGVKNPTQTVEVATENREFNKSVNTEGGEPEIDYEEKIRTLFNHLDWIIILNDIQDVGQLKRFIPEEIENNLVLKNLYIKTIELNEIRLRDFIKDYNLNFENIRKEKDFKKLLDFINHLSKFDKDSFDYRTPMKLVEQMVNMCSDLTKNSIVWDPCVGTGNILHYLHYILGIPKDNLYGTDNNPYFVKLLNKLGYKNVTLLDLTDKEQVENYIKNMNMKFDFIIMNPPYNGGLYKKIIDTTVKFTDKLVVLCPWSIITDAKKGKKVKTFLSDHVTEYHQVSGLEAFGIDKQLLVGCFDFTKLSLKSLKPFEEGSIDESIFSKLQNFQIQLKDYIYWSEGIVGGARNNDFEKCKKFVNSSYNHQTLVAISAKRYINKILTEPNVVIGVSCWGIKDKIGYDFIKASSSSKDWRNLVIYILSVAGDGRDLCDKEVSYVPLITSYSELGLTDEEIERINSFSN